MAPSPPSCGCALRAPLRAHGAKRTAVSGDVAGAPCAQAQAKLTCEEEADDGVPDPSKKDLASCLGPSRRLRSEANGRDFGVGRFKTLTLDELRALGEQHGAHDDLAPDPRITWSHVALDDALAEHATPGHSGAMFQVASQLNCLEFINPERVPEDGITCYAADPTQGRVTRASFPARLLRARRRARPVPTAAYRWGRRWTVVCGTLASTWRSRAPISPASVAPLSGRRARWRPRPPPRTATTV